MERKGIAKLMKPRAILRIGVIAASLGLVSSAFAVTDKCSLKTSGRTAAFDVEHDRDTVGGGSLFCTLGITATQVTHAIADFKASVSEPGRVPAIRILRFPIEVVYSAERDGKHKDSSLMLRNRVEWARFVRDKLNERQLAAIKAAKLSDIMMVNSKGAGPGFILGNGLVFFSTRNTQHIRVWHLNTEVMGD